MTRFAFFKFHMLTHQHLSLQLVKSLQWNKGSHKHYQIAAIATLWWYFFSSVSLGLTQLIVIIVYYSYTYIGHLWETIMWIMCGHAWFQLNPDSLYLLSMCYLMHIHVDRSKMHLFEYLATLRTWITISGMIVEIQNKVQWLCKI